MVFEVSEAAQVNLESLEQSCLKPLQNFEESNYLTVLIAAKFAKRHQVTPIHVNGVILQMVCKFPH